MSLLASKLQSKGLNFKEEGGLLKGIYQLSGGRSQLFFLDPDADHFMGMGDYDFMSVVGSSTDAVKVRQACERVGGMKRGGIVVRQGQIMVKMEVPTEISDDSLMAHVVAVCTLADELEQELFTGDRW